MSLKEFAKYRSRSLEGRKRSRSNSESSSSSSSSSSSEKRRKRKRAKKAERKERHSQNITRSVKHKRKKRKHSRDNSSSSDSDTFQKRKTKSKHKSDRKKKKKKEKKNKKDKTKKHFEPKADSPIQSKEATFKMKPATSDQGPSLQDIEQQPKKRSMAPMTREEYEHQQSKVRKVYDPDTGRHRLIKGDGEIIEEIVSYDRHKMINKMATLGDGAAFQANLAQKHKFS